MKMFAKSLLWKKTHTMIFTATLICIMITAALSVTSVRASPITVVASPSSGSAGTIVSVSGNDATAYGEVRVYLDYSIGFFMATTIANSTGGYSTNVTVPAFPSGPCSILVLDITTDDTAFVPFIIQTKIAVTPDEGSCNDEVTVAGYGFDSVSLITLTFNGTNVTPWPQPQTDEFGSFKAKFYVPKVPNGTYDVNASDGTNYALASFKVIPKITLSPTSGPSATAVFISGTGFTPSALVSIEFSHINVTMYPPFPTDLDGSFMQLFFVPEVSDGLYTVNATDDTGNSAVAQFLVPSPILTLEPDTVTGSSIVIAKGSGFPPNQPVLLYLEDNMMVGLVDLMIGSEALFADEYGIYEYSFIVPVAKPGVYQVIAYSIDGFGFVKGEELASAPITIVADALLLEIKDKIATIIIPDLGIIKENLTAIDAKLVSIEGTIVTIDSTMGSIQADVESIQLSITAIDGTIVTINSTIGSIQVDIESIRLNVTAIDGNIATIQTTLGTIEGKITSIEGNTATIETDVGTVITEISNVKGNQETFTIPLYASLALVLIAAAGAIFLTIIHVIAMRKTGPE